VHVVLLDALLRLVIGALREEEVPFDEGLEDESDCLHVVPLVVVAGDAPHLHLPHQLFGRELHAGPVAEVLGAWINLVCAPEVDDFAVVLGVHDHVLGLEVVVAEPEVMQYSVGVQDHADHYSHGSLAEAVGGLEDYVEDLPYGALLDDFERILRDSQHLEGVGVVHRNESLEDHLFLFDHGVINTFFVFLNDLGILRISFYFYILYS